MDHGGEREPLGKLGGGQCLVVIGEGLQYTLIPLVSQDLQWGVVVTVKDVSAGQNISIKILNTT